VAIALSSITKILFNFAWIGLAISIVSLVHTTRFLLGRLQKIKYGKPYGYYRHLLIKKLQKNNFIAAFLNIPYIQREGKWSVRRKTC
jgi:hypothetical protein